MLGPLVFFFFLFFFYVFLFLFCMRSRPGDGLAHPEDRPVRSAVGLAALLSPLSIS